MATNTTDDVKIVISADTTGLTSGINKAKNSVKDFENTAKQAGDKVDNLGNKAKQAGDKVKDVGNTGGAGFGKLGAKIGLAAGAMGGLINAAVSAGRAIVDALGKSVMAASDFNENVSKTQVVFGEYADKYIAQSKRMAATTGLSANQFLEQMSLWGSMAQAMGIPTDKMREMSETLTTLSADMASFHNKDIAQVQTALKGVFTGETEALKEFGVVMTETNLEKFAADQGKVYKAMTQAEKVQLRYNFVLDQQRLAIGDYARTNEGFANSFRTLKSNIENAMIGIGQKILPPIQDAMNKVNMAFKGLNTTHEQLDQELVDSQTRMAGLVQRADELKQAGMENTDEWKQVQEAMDGESRLQGTINGAKAIKDKFEEIKPIIDGAIDGIKRAGETFLIPFKAAGTVIGGIARGIQPWLQPIFDTIYDIKQHVSELIDKIFGNKENFYTFLDTVKGLLDGIGWVLGNTIGFILWVIGKTLDGIVWLIGQIIETGQALVQAWNDTIGSWIGWLWGKLEDIWNWFWNLPENIKNWWSDTCDWLRGKWNEFLEWAKNIDILEMFFGALKNIGGWLNEHVLQPILTWFKELPGKIWNGIKDGLNWLGDQLNPTNWFTVNATQQVQQYMSLTNGLTPNGGNSYSRTQVYNFNYNLQHAPTNSFISNQKAAVESGAMYGVFNNGSW